MEEVVKMKGVFDLTNRIAKALLSKPLFKRNLTTVLNNLDPENARDLVNTLIWDDLGIGLLLVDAAPKLVNALILVLDEVLKQVDDHFNPGFLQEITQLILEDVDFVTLKNVSEGFGRLGALLAPVYAQVLAVSNNQTTQADEALTNPGGEA